MSFSHRMTITFVARFFIVLGFTLMLAACGGGGGDGGSVAVKSCELNTGKLDTCTLG